ncbi:LysR family transcriptional regulator [Terrihabitans rhizophilus]|jgi:DNA-binding transcriptional LysR family regulator|uniref:LysR family transcriptional regulator n=1 Tax=Terrihabitans rhizophilus TaxID=3092662 RepID=A0ABU4RLC0_9HYPH|nr:LysR family transcriptional regulator [Terrihabitans sp. PJ23]MDX6805625.1 LysR family transcriptional regulator [Terrihabitans sp. PJ23]
MSLDWDKLRVFHAAAEAKSFTHGGDKLGLSQSAVSRQVSALETELKVPLFHRHARGLLLTEPGELLFRTTQELFAKLESTKLLLTDSRERPHGMLKVTTSVGLGGGWLSPLLGEFLDLYPEISVTLMLTDDELDLAMREADVGIRLRQPTQSELIQRKLFPVHYHVYASPDYIERFGEPREAADLDRHRIVGFGGLVPTFLQPLNWLAYAGREDSDPRQANMSVNNMLGLKRAVEGGVGLGVLPQYLIEGTSSLVRVMQNFETPTLEAYLAYPEELRSVRRIQVFRDFLLSKVAGWS